MTFFIVKLISPFFMPPTLIVIGLLLCWFLLRKNRVKIASRLLIIVILFFYLLSISPTAYLLANSLEIKYSSVKENVSAEAIVVLAGGASKVNGKEELTELSGSSWRRLWHGVELYKKEAGRMPILYSGGSGNPFNKISYEAETARKIAVTMGVPENKFLIETESRNTHENGLAVKKLLDEKFPNNREHEIILVTSALHMPRSMAVMKKVGIRAVAEPTDLISSDFSLTPLGFFPSQDYFSNSILSLHEWVGLVGYKVLGWI